MTDVDVRWERLDSQLSRLEKEVSEGKATIAQICADVQRLDGGVRDAIAELGGVPDYRARGERSTVRTRLHKVEQDSLIIQALGERLIKGLDDVSEVTEKLERWHDDDLAVKLALADAEDKRRAAWSLRQKIGLFMFAAIGAAGTIVSIVVLVTQ